MNSTSWLWAPGWKAPVVAGKIPSPICSTATVTPAVSSWTERAVARASSNGIPSRATARRAARDRRGLGGDRRVDRLAQRGDRALRLAAGSRSPATPPARSVAS